MKFLDRTEAGELLAGALIDYKGRKDTLVLGIPRGGVVIADVIAKNLQLPIDVALCKKIGYPHDPNFAIGAVTLEGFAVNIEDVPGDFIMSEVRKIQSNLKKLYEDYCGAHKCPSVKGKTIILVDEGVLTGNTLSLTLDILRHKEPKEIIIAVPVAPPESLKLLAQDADKIVCLTAPDNFQDIADYFDNFEQTTQDEAIHRIREAHERVLNKTS
ncbi:MAG: hypothetical protein SP1CHLAM54_10910 [Chlamydiia bacterium]|nr:hypothetical protein [Chlamydiia bacterium]MCH9615996.1 hypothetical protein [Chlamydiia bacterium]MCH9629019.1 hypothetical protein [Chlamydiia bacterium]